MWRALGTYPLKTRAKSCSDQPEIFRTASVSERNESYGRFALKRHRLSCPYTSGKPEVSVFSNFMSRTIALYKSSCCHISCIKIKYLKRVLSKLLYTTKTKQKKPVSNVAFHCYLQKVVTARVRTGRVRRCSNGYFCKGF